MAEPADINVDELRRRARRRLVGAVVLALAVAVIVPMLLETEQKPLGEDVSVKIPPIDDSKFVNRLNENRAKDVAKGPAKTPPPAIDEAAKGTAANPASQTPPATTEHPAKYDTRIPDTAASSAAPATAPNPSAAPDAAAMTAGKAADAIPAPDSRATDSPPSSATQASAAKSAPVETAKPPTPSTTATVNGSKAAPASTTHEGFAVQLAAFADDKGASALAGRLKKAGFAAYTEPLKTSKGTLWRVRVGPYPSRDAAVAARDKLKMEGQSGIVAALK